MTNFKKVKNEMFEKHSKVEDFNSFRLIENRKKPNVKSKWEKTMSFLKGYWVWLVLFVLILIYISYSIIFLDPSIYINNTTLLLKIGLILSLLLFLRKCLQWYSSIMYVGFYSSKGTEGVGKAANSAVVASMFIVFIEEILIVQLLSFIN